MNGLFFLFSVLMVFGSLMCMNSLNPIHSVFWLVSMFFFSFALLINLNLEFLSLLLIMIYVGAMVILFLFVMMMLDMVQMKKNSNMNNMIPIILILLTSLIIKIICNQGLVPYFLDDDFLNFNLINYHNFHNLVLFFYSKYFMNFLLMSIILSMSMMGAVVLTIVHNSNSSKQKMFVQHLSNNSWN